MRPIWKGQISFGLIYIPVELYSAESRTDISFKLLDGRDKAKIRYERINEETGEEVPWNEVVKAYEIRRDKYVVLTEEDFKHAFMENTQSIEIEDFVSQEYIDSTYFEKPYFLVPTKGAQKGYVLLREVLKKTNKVAIGKVVIRTRQYLAALLAHEDALILNLLRFSQELRSSKDFDFPKGNLKEYKITGKEFEMAEKLVDSMTVAWNPKKYHDEYRDSLMKWIVKKAKKGKIPLSEPEKKEELPGAQVIDFMELLKKSIKKKEPKHKKSTSSKSRRAS